MSDNPFQNLLGLENINSKLEKVINNSDQIIYTSEETKNLVNKKYDKNINYKSYVIPHCYDKNLYIFNQTIYDTKILIQKEYLYLDI